MAELAAVLQEHGFSQPLSQQSVPGAEQPLQLLRLPGSTALESWQKLRQLVTETGHWPVILGPVENLDFLRDNWEFEADFPAPAEVLKKAAQFELQRWLDECTAEQALDNSFDPAEFEEFAEFFQADMTQSNHGFTIHTDILSRQPYSEVLFALVPTVCSWEVPAWLHTGGWNECPQSEVHIRLLETWYVRYGAELLGHSNDVLELRVARPVQVLEEARELARLQYAYCPDIVDQGVQTLENLALSLCNSTVWYFWWD